MKNKALPSLMFTVFQYLLLASFGVSAQSMLITGQVADHETRKPLVFASITLKGRPIGTVSNNDGVFDFEIPASYSSDTLMVSMLGFSSYTKCLKDISPDHKLSIQLQPRAIQLAEVKIKATALDAREIVKKALHHVDENYPLQPYSMDAFFRQTHEENNKSVQLVEAAILIDDPGYKTRGRDLNEKVFLKSVRASKNYRNDLLMTPAVGKFNLLVSAIRCNPVKYQNPKLFKNAFELDSIVSVGDRQFYIISFLTYISRFPNFESKNTLYIDTENYAIHKYTWEEYAKTGIYSETPWALTETFENRRKRISTVYEYEPYNGKMYLRYFNEKCYWDIYNVKNNAVEFGMLGETTLVVTSIQTKTVNVPQEKLMKTDRSLSAQVTTYESGFWNTFNQMVPLTKQQVRDLEWEMPLKEQFKIAGNHEHPQK